MSAPTRRGPYRQIDDIGDAQRAFPTSAQGTCGGHRHPGGSCRAPIVWCVTDASGSKQPVDPVPVRDGILILAVTDDGRAVRSRVETLFDTSHDEGGPQRHMPHHATCVDVDLWRERQRHDPADPSTWHPVEL